MKYDTLPLDFPVHALLSRIQCSIQNFKPIIINKDNN